MDGWGRRLFATTCPFRSGPPWTVRPKAVVLYQSLWKGIKTAGIRPASYPSESDRLKRGGHLRLKASVPTVASGGGSIAPSLLIRLSRALIDRLIGFSRSGYLPTLGWASCVWICILDRRQGGLHLQLHAS
jgi:hypothetical protein